jgi:hypothetical protein
MASEESLVIKSLCVHACAHMQYTQYLKPSSSYKIMTAPKMAFTHWSSDLPSFLA